MGDGGVEESAVENSGDRIFELAQVFLAEATLTHGGPLLLKEGRRDARAIGGGGPDAHPLGAAMGPGFVEEAPLAEGGAHEPEGAGADGEHGAKGHIEVIGDARGFVDEEQGDAREAAVGGFGSGQADNAGFVGESQGDLVIAIALGLDAELAGEGGGLAEELGALARAGTDDDGEAGGPMESMVDGLGGGDGGFAPLPGAVEDPAFGVGVKHGRLKSIGREPQGMANPLGGAQGSWRGCRRRGAFRYGFHVPHSRFEGSMGKQGRRRVGRLNRLESAT
jgi:hypothetical protein